MEEDNKKYEKGTLGWLREQQKIKAKKDGFDNVDKWLKWKNRSIEEKYGKEFADWAIQNKGKIPNKWLNAGCKTEKEYKDFLAKRLGLKDWAEWKREWRYEKGESLPLEFNEDCSSHFGEFTEKIMIHRYPCAVKMPYGNLGFDYLWKDEDGKEVKIDNKGRCLQHVWGGSPRFQFEIWHNNVAKKFILSGWDNRESLTPLIALEFDRDDKIRYGQGRDAPKIEFWKRYNFTLTYNPEGLEQFGDYQIDIGWMVDLSKELKENMSL